MAKRKNTPALVEISKGSQSVKFQELLTAANGDRLRVDIESDAYTFQCHARVERWDGTKWNRVWHINTGRMHTQAGLVYVPRPVTAADFDEDRDTLVAMAAAILNTKAG